MLLSAPWAALSTFYPGRQEHLRPGNSAAPADPPRLIAKMPTLAAYAYRHSRSACPTSTPDNDLSYAANFLSMLFEDRPRATTSPTRSWRRRIDVLFILHADHEQNCSATSPCASVGSSSQPDPFSAIAAGDRGPLRPAPRRRQRGGAATCSEEIGSENRIPEFLKRVKDRQDPPPDGLRPPGLQELRPARQDHQADWPTRSSQ